MKYMLIILVLSVVQCWSEEPPSSFPNTMAVLKWSADNIDSSPKYTLADESGFQILVIWGNPDEDSDKTKVLTAIKKDSNETYHKVLVQLLDSIDYKIDGKDPEHFGRIEYDKDAKVLLFFTDGEIGALLMSFDLSDK